MPILEDENRALRQRIHELEGEIRDLKASEARLLASNAHLQNRLQSLTAQHTPGAEKRHHNRIAAAFRIDSMNSRGESAMGVARDVSLGGAFIETDLRLSVGETMRVAFDLLGHPFKLQAEVVRVSDKGFGVKFSMESRQQELLKQHIARL